jgi:hypothetical protein
VAKMDDLDKLPSDLVWQQDGHLSDIVLSSVADGETDIVPLEALSHLEHCEQCSTRFGAEALLSMHASELLAEVSRASAHAPAAVPSRAARVAVEGNLSHLPKRAIFGALALAAMGSMPALVAGGHFRIAEITGMLGRSILMLSRSMVLVAKSDSFTALIWASSMVLLILGLVVSRVARPRSVNGLAEEGGV